MIISNLLQLMGFTVIDNRAKKNGCLWVISSKEDFMVMKNVFANEHITFRYVEKSRTVKKRFKRYLPAWFTVYRESPDIQKEKLGLMLRNLFMSYSQVNGILENNNRDGLVKVLDRGLNQGECMEKNIFELQQNSTSSEKIGAVIGLRDVWGEFATEKWDDDDDDDDPEEDFFPSGSEDFALLAGNVIKWIFKNINLSPKQIVGLGRTLYALERMPKATCGIDCEFRISFTQKNEGVNETHFAAFFISEFDIAVRTGVYIDEYGEEDSAFLFERNAAEGFQDYDDYDAVNSAVQECLKNGSEVIVVDRSEDIKIND